MAILLVLLVVLATPVLMITSAMWWGYTLTCLWAWFIVPQFALPMLSLPAAIGVSATVRFLTWQNPPYIEDTRSSTKQIFHGLTVAYLSPAFTLLFGYIVKQYL